MRYGLGIFIEGPGPRGTSTDRTGTLNKTLASATLSATSQLLIQANLTVTLDDAVLFATVSLAVPSDPIYFGNKYFSPRFFGNRYFMTVVVSEGGAFSDDIFMSVL